LTPQKFCKLQYEFRAFTHHYKTSQQLSFRCYSACLVLAISGFATSCIDAEWNDITTSPPAADDSTITIEIYARQFEWTIRYTGEDNELGVCHSLLTSAKNPLAIAHSKLIEERLAELDSILAGPDSTDAKQQRFRTRLEDFYHRGSFVRKVSDEAPVDDVIVQEFHLVIDQPYLLQFRSRDVIHSAYMPHFRVQMNTVPGMVTPLRFTPTKTTAEMRIELNDPDFEYLLMCNRICGANHYNMHMNVVVETQAEFDRWMARQQTFSEQVLSVKK
jgi:cytochrome c oxidase subunit 2